LDLNRKSFTCDIIYKDTSISTSQIIFNQRSIFFLSSSIPKFKLILWCIVFAKFREEVHTNGGLNHTNSTWVFYSNLFLANLLITDDFPTPLSPRNTIFTFCLTIFYYSFLSISIIILKYLIYDFIKKKEE
jgi:hypothetical protein